MSHQIAVVAMLFCISLFMHSRLMTKFERQTDEQITKAYYHFSSKLSLTVSIIGLVVAIIAKLFY